MSPVDRILAALRSHGHEPRRSGEGWSCRCPAHDDQTPSLSIGEGDDGGAVVFCHGKCKTPEVVAAVGLKMRDLMPDKSPPASLSRRGGDETPSRGAGNGGCVAVASVATPERAFSTAREAVAELERRHGSRRSASWTYMNEAEVPVGVMVRWDRSEAEKDVLPVSLNGAGWVLKGMPIPRPLYGLPDLAKAPAGSRVYVCEGEKATDAARACGLLATTSSHGCKSPGKSDWSPLAGHDVVILPDRDDAGEKYAKAVTGLVMAAGAKSVGVVRLWEKWQDLPKGGDMADVLELAGGDSDGVREAVEALVDASEPEGVDPPQRTTSFVPFPVDVLPDPIRSYVANGAKAIGCDASFIALPILSALASAIGNTHRLALKRSWAEPAIIWTAIVGESGTAKSPALELALRAVRKRQHRAMKEHAEAVKGWESDNARWEAEFTDWKKKAANPGAVSDPPEAPAKPVCPRTWTDDTTTEALVARLQENPRGLLMVRDELSGWFDFGRYTGGKGASEAARWLEVFGGRALIVDRKTSGTEYVPSASVSIAGGIQPEALRRALGQENRDNGLAARLLFAMPPRRAKRWTEDDVDERIEAAVEGVFDRLYALEPGIDAEGDPEPRLLKLSHEAKRAWVQFADQHADEQVDLIGDEAAAWSKLEGYVPRLALVIHLTRVAANDETIANPEMVDEVSLAAGVVLVHWFAGEAERVYALLGGDEEHREHHRLVEWIEGKGGAVTVRQLARSLSKYRKAGEAKKALDDLVEVGLGRWVADAAGPQGGRPSQRFQLLSADGDTGDGDETPSGGVKNGGCVAVATVTSPRIDDNDWGEI